MFQYAAAVDGVVVHSGVGGLAVNLERGYLAAVDELGEQVVLAAVAKAELEGDDRVGESLDAAEGRSLHYAAVYQQADADCSVVFLAAVEVLPVCQVAAVNVAQGYLVGAAYCVSLDVVPGVGLYETGTGVVVSDLGEGVCIAVAVLAVGDSGHGGVGGVS